MARQNAVADLEQQDELRERLQQLLKKLPDLERLLSRVHVGSCKLADLLALLDAIEQVESVMRSLSASVDLSSLQSARLRRLLTVGQGFPELQPVLTAMQALFDRKKARDEGSVLPRPGAMPEYDAAIEEAKRCEALLQEELQAACDVLGAKAGKAGGVVFWHPNAGKERYQLQVPSNLAEKVPSSWRLLSSTKNVRRYHSPGIKAPLQGWLEAEETQTQVLRNFFRTILQRLDGHNGVLSAGVATLAELDCLMSLHTARAGMGEPMCRPEFVPLSEAPDQRALLDFTGVRHPCMSGEGLSAGGSSGGGAGSVAGGSTSFIPNDTRLGVAEEGSPERIMLLTGPNMGGKSTLLRQTCVAVILAQLGGWVPAERCRLTPVDRIFTRIGANDNIMAGHSTFMVELKETAAILNKATPQSLVILDELGRGTSTFDGYAIAHAVLKHLAEVVRCRCMFATHYHLLTDEFERHLEVGNYNMACVVDEERHDVLFLYKLQRGVCSKSYGMNVAAMAGVPVGEREIVRVCVCDAADGFRKELRNGGGRTDFALLMP